MKKDLIAYRESFNATFSSLKIRNFRLYFLGQTVSVAGTFMQTIAQAWLVLKLTGSGTALGIVTALQYLPILLFAPVGGLVADSYPKKKLLLATQSASGVLALVLGVLVATGAVRLWMVYLLALSLGIINAIDNPTRQTFISEMVGSGEVRNAVALNGSMVNMSRIIGPAIGGVLIVTVGLAPCFIINGLSYGAVLAGLIMMRDNELHCPTPVSHSKGRLRESLAYVRSNPTLLTVLIMMAVIGTLSYEFQVSLPLIADFTFHGDAESYALLTSAMGVGAVAGGLITASRKRTTPRMYAQAGLLFGVTILIASAMPTIWLASAAMLLVGVTSLMFMSQGNTILQLESDPQMRGRVMSFWSMAFLGSTAIGGPLVGWVGETFGPRWGLVIGGAAAVAAGIWGLNKTKEKVKQA